MALLDYGYSVSALYEDPNKEKLPSLPVKGGVLDETALIYKEPFRYLDIKGSDLSGIQKTISLP